MLGDRAWRAAVDDAQAQQRSCYARFPVMSERSSSLTRRDVFKGAVALATLGAGSVLAGRDVAAVAASPANRTGSGGPRTGRHRVAIIGAGAGGVAAAYFLAGTHGVDLFEARSKIDPGRPL